MTESRSVVTQGEGCGEEGEGVINKRHEKILGGEGYMFPLLVVVMGSWIYIYVKICQIIHFFVQLIICQLYLNKAFSLYKYLKALQEAKETVST